MKQVVWIAALAGFAAAVFLCPLISLADTTTESAPSGEAAAVASPETTPAEELKAPAPDAVTTETDEQDDKSTAPEQLPPIRLLGPDGERLTTGSVWVSHEAPYSFFKTLPAAAIPMDDGEFRPTMSQLREAFGGFLRRMFESDTMDSFRVFATSPRLAPQVVTGWTATSGPLEIKMRGAQRVELHLQTPDGKPLTTTATVFAGNPGHYIVKSVAGRADFWPLPIVRFFEAKEQAPGIYTFDADPESTVAVYVDAPGHIRYWAIPALSPDEVRGGKVTLQLPQPARLKVCLEPDTPITGRKPFHRLWALVAPVENEVLQWFSVGASVDPETAETSETALREEFSGLAPGRYRVSFSAQHPRGWLAEGHSVSVDQKTVVLVPGDNPPVTAQYWLKSADRYRGDFAATVKVLRADGTPAAGAEYVLQVNDALYGRLVIEKGALPESGEVRIERLAGVTEAIPTTAPEARRIRPYDLTVSATELGRLRLYTHDSERDLLEPLPDGAKEKTFEFRLPPVVGDLAPDVEFASVTEEGRTLRLSELKGQVVFIDFWATWCGSCQKPMASLNDLAREKAADWESRVTLLGASIDDDRETVFRHIQRNKWMDVKQFWCGEERPENPATVYGVRGVPTCFLIGRDGRILWSGHPAEIDKHKTIEDALAQP